MDLTAIIKKIRALDTEKKIRFMILFGSTAQGKNRPGSDLDIAIYYDDNPTRRFKFRMKILGAVSDKIDAHIFQDLPLALKKEILSGKILYYDNYYFTFSEFMKVIKEFNRFEKHVHEYYAALEGEHLGT